MRRLFLLIAVIAFAVNSCKKQQLASDNPLIGKWKATSYKLEDKCTTSPSNPDFNSPVKPIMKIEIEILRSGDFITTFEGEKEKLKFIEVKESVSMAEFHMVFTAVKKYDCKVRNKKGQVFNFHFYFGGATNKMVGTYWTPNHAYVTQKIPNHTFAICEWGSQSYEGYETEYFAVYQKL